MKENETEFPWAILNDAVFIFHSHFFIFWCDLVEILKNQIKISPSLMILEKNV
jgi:hypothetical protein